MYAISNVYNYYMTTTPAKGRGQKTNKYDTHPKSELKEIYNSIVKKSIESPVYLFDHSKETLQFAIDVKEEARELKNTLSALTAEEDSNSVFGQKIATSSNPEAVSVNYLGKRPGINDEMGFTLDVEQLASPQVNTGAFLSPNKLRLIPNNYSFNIETGGLSYEFQFQVSLQDTNRVIQDRLASLINKSNIGVTAEVVTDPGTGYTALQMVSKSTGSNNGKLLFEVNDENISHEKGAVEYLGLDHVSHKPQNASFLLDGDRHSASSNTFTVNQSFEISLLNVTDEDNSAVIGFQADIDTVSDNIKEMTKKYNSMITLSGSYSSEHIRTNLLQNQISSVAKKHANDLESIGLQLTKDGSIQVDEQLLNQALNEDMTETIDTLVDFKSSLFEKTEDVMLNPMDYVDKRIVAYPNPNKAFANPYLTSIYSGMFFSSYC